MKCLYPQRGIRHVRGHKFHYTYRCGTCEACLLHRKIEWTGRIMLEDRCHDSSVFVTLTYAAKYEPEGSVLVLDDLQYFLKRLRRNLQRKYGDGFKIRYFACGEYGGKFGRPHYHLVVFGLHWTAETEDIVQKSWSVCTNRRDSIYEPIGFTTVSELTIGRAAYVVDYMLKQYDTKIRDDGRPVEFATMSRNPALGSCMVPAFFETYNRNGLFKAEDEFKQDLQINTASLYRLHGRHFPFPRIFILQLQNMVRGVPLTRRERVFKLQQLAKLRGYNEAEDNAELSKAFKQSRRNNIELFSEQAKQARQRSRVIIKNIKTRRDLKNGKK